MSRENYPPAPCLSFPDQNKVMPTVRLNSVAFKYKTADLKRVVASEANMRKHEFSACFLPLFIAFKKCRGMTRRISGQINESNTQQMTFPQCLISTCQLQECHHPRTERFKARLFIRQQTIIPEV